MGFGKNEKGFLFNVKEADGRVKALFSSSYKKGEEWADDFFAEVSLYGDAAEKAKALEGRTFVELTEAKTSSRKGKDGKTYYNFPVFDFEVIPPKE